MGLLERYKKAGGFVQLLQLLETCTPQKRDKFLSMIREENQHWEAALRPRILTVDRIFTWSPVILTEILTRLQTINIAVLYSSFDEKRRNQMNSILNFNQHKQVKQLVEDKKFSLSEVNISMEKFLVETRSLINLGVIKLDRIDPELEVPTDIEEKLNTAQLLKSVAGNAPFAIPSQPVYMSQEKKYEIASEAYQPPPVVSLAKVNLTVGPTKVAVAISESRIVEAGYDGNDVRMPFEPPSLENLLSKAESVKEKEKEKELIEELKKFKEQVQVLNQENLMLRHEVDVLRDKLERIKKIA
jgi:hypothetical protein